MSNKKSQPKSSLKAGSSPVVATVEAVRYIGDVVGQEFIINGSLQHGKAAVSAYNAAIKGAYAHLQYNKFLNKREKIAFFE